MPKLIIDVLLPDSSDAIVTRMWTSQQKLTMPADRFASGVVDRALRKNPPRYLSIGGGAIIWKIFLWLPRWLALDLFWYAFGKRK